MLGGLCMWNILVCIMTLCSLSLWFLHVQCLSTIFLIGVRIMLHITVFFFRTWIHTVHIVFVFAVLCVLENVLDYCLFFRIWYESSWIFGGSYQNVPYLFFQLYYCYIGSLVILLLSLMGFSFMLPTQM